MDKVLKYALIPLCLILSIYIGLVINKENLFQEENKVTRNIKVYAYQVTEEEQERKELKENIKLELPKYNKVMSSVPGYPILFELENIDNINILVENGNVYDYNQVTGKVTKLENKYQLTTNKKLYFNINENTIIKITGMAMEKIIFEKNIIFSRDSEFNYYALLK